MSHVNLADSYQFTGDLHAALEHNELSLGFVSRIGHTNLVATQHGNLGEVLLLLGETDEALKHLEEAVRPRAEQGVNPMVTGIALVLLCRARVWAGDLDAAQRALHEGRGILEGIDAQGLLLDADIVDAELRLAQGYLEQAEISCRRALAQAQSMGAEVSEAEALCVLGQIQLAMGDAEAAIPGLEACVALAAEERVGPRAGACTGAAGRGSRIVSVEASRRRARTTWPRLSVCSGGWARATTWSKAEALRSRLQALA